MQTLAIPQLFPEAATRYSGGWHRFVGIVLLTATVVATANQNNVETTPFRGVNINPAVPAHAEAISTVLDASGETYLLNCNAALTLPRKPREALENGLPLVFLTTIRVERRRQWWFDSVLTQIELRHRLEYQQLARRYSVTRLFNGDRSTHSSLQSALREIARLERYPLIEARRIKSSASYHGTLAMSLDTATLPTPLQPQTYLSSDWKLLNEVYTWEID